MEEQAIDVMARVDHAGEYGAIRIYQGQSAIFHRRDKQSARETDEMAAHERVHLTYFEERLSNQQLRPTIFLPLWHVGGFALGAATALMGRKAAFACTQAVEEVIDQHYTRQIDELGEGDHAFKEKLIAFRDDERAHHEIAALENKEDYPVLRFGIGALCRVAIALSSRF